MAVTAVSSLVLDAPEIQSSWYPHNGFSNATMEEIEKSVIAKSTRADVTEFLGHQMWIHTKMPTSAGYMAVCRMLHVIAKFQILEETLGNGIVC